MPVMDGYSCTEEIRKRDWVYAGVPIFAATAGGLVEAIERSGKRREVPPILRGTTA